MEQFAGTSLRMRLNLIVLVAFIPVAILIYYVAEHQKSQEISAVLAKTEILAKAAADEENQKTQSVRNLLTTVADMVVVAGESPGRLDNLFATLKNQSVGYAGFGVADANGHLLVGSGVTGKDAAVVGREWFAGCLARNTFTVEAYPGTDIGTGGRVLHMALPAKGPGEDTAVVVFALVRLDWLNRPLLQRLDELPTGSRVTLLSGGGGAIRYDAAAGLPGASGQFDPPLERRIWNEKAGTFSAVDGTGVSRIYAFASFGAGSELRRDAVVLEIPRKAALSASSRSFYQTLSSLMLSALMAVLAIWWAGDRLIVSRVRQMVSASRQLAAGDLGARIGRIGAEDEINHLARVFDEMADTLQTRIEQEAESREKMRRMAAHQQQVREQERIRIAREIHDRLGQTLTILKMDLSWLIRNWQDKDPEATDKMVGMAEVIDASLGDLQRVTSELRPRILDDFGLTAAIEWQMEEFRKHSGIACRLETAGSEPALTGDQATALFRIFQETLTNILRHADASEVNVRVAADDDELVLEVRDNGRGITEDEIRGPDAHGLLGIQERLYPWNGRAAFEGEPGRGTCVTVRLPLDRKGESR